MLNIKQSDIFIDYTRAAISIESSKTDQFRDGAWIVIAKTGTKLCPVINLISYMDSSKMDTAE